MTYAKLNFLKEQFDYLTVYKNDSYLIELWAMHIITRNLITLLTYAKLNCQR